MKTTISEFCAELGELLFPLAEALGDTVGATETLSDTDTPLAEVGQGLAGVKYRLDALINKVQGQEAYVLLFGPLKSGKSTLINAISGGYVSEVTSLPAYPCMVHLKYAPAPSYSVIRYSGKREQIESSQALLSLLEQSHRTLSERIRAMDDFGEAFDPEVHLPSAIRRVQVELPVENLRESGTVLVDTPGLYSKMKFGYDYLTQEFRDSAACAVFVVKTDNLFLEQVFSDFNDLLDQFSRVFVVVNVDIGKSDLQPDGSLEPSLESRDPDQIVKAFEVLTMSAPLRRAAETGRLHIYPIDLRSAATKRLRPETIEPEEDNGEPDRFEHFLSDLMTYLNSTDYLLEFMADSIRQSARLGEEVLQLCQSDTSRGLDAEHSRLVQELASLERLESSASAAAQTDWSAQFTPVAERLASERQELRTQALADVDERAAELAEAWENSDQSLDSLRQELGGMTASTLADFQARAAAGIATLDGGRSDSETMPEAMVRRLDALGIDPATCRPSPPTFEPEQETRLEPPTLEAIPVTRSVTDRLLFRTDKAIRERLLEPTDQEVPATLKKKRFPDATSYIRTSASEALAEALYHVESKQVQPAVDQYMASLAESTTKAVSSRRKQVAQEIAQHKADLNRLDTMQKGLARLRELAAGVKASIGSLEKRHQEKIGLMKGTVEEELPPTTASQ